MPYIPKAGGAVDLTGAITSVGPATSLGSFMAAQLNAALSDFDAVLLGTPNSGNLLFTDNTYTIGQSGSPYNRPQSIYVSNLVSIGSGGTMVIGADLQFFANSNGLRIANAVGNAAIPIVFGGYTSSFPRIGISGTTFVFNLGDNTSGGAVNFTGAVITTPQTLSGAGAVNLTTATTHFTSTGAGEILTLANGTVGQRKVLVHSVKGASGTGVLTPTTTVGFTTATVNNAGDSIELEYTAAGWSIVGSFGTVIA